MTRSAISSSLNDAERQNSDVPTAPPMTMNEEERKRAEKHQGQRLRERHGQIELAQSDLTQKERESAEELAEGLAQKPIGKRIKLAMKAGQKAEAAERRSHKLARDSLGSLYELFILACTDPQVLTELKERCADDDVIVRADSPAGVLLCKLVLRCDRAKAWNYGTALRGALMKRLTPSALRSQFDSGEVTIERLVRYFYEAHPRTETLALAKRRKEERRKAQATERAENAEAHTAKRHAYFSDEPTEPTVSGSEDCDPGTSHYYGEPLNPTDLLEFDGDALDDEADKAMANPRAVFSKVGWYNYRKLANGQRAFLVIDKVDDDSFQVSHAIGIPTKRS